MSTEDIDHQTAAMPAADAPDGEELRNSGHSRSSATDHDYADDIDDFPAPRARPRRRLLTGVTALLVVGVVAVGGFFAGVQVQKHQGSSSGTTSAAGANGFAAAFRRFGAGAGGTGSAGGLAAGGAGGAGAGATPTAGSETRTAGTVKLVDGTDVYVTEANGNTILVTTDKATTMTKSATASVNDVTPGQTVVISGIQNKDGSIQGTSLSVGGSSGGIGLGGLGGGTTGATGAGSAGAGGPNG